MTYYIYVHVLNLFWIKVWELRRKEEKRGIDKLLYDLSCMHVLICYICWDWIVVEELIVMRSLGEKLCGISGVFGEIFWVFLQIFGIWVLCWIPIDRSWRPIDRIQQRSNAWAIDRLRVPIDRSIDRAIDRFLLLSEFFFYFSFFRQTYMDTWYMYWGIGGRVCRCIACDFLCFSN